ncbi:MAG: hypothetical protein ACJAXW_000980 [Candidatus Azotimanducaceae bacterium]|jgi:hypothetical protein
MIATLLATSTLISSDIVNHLITSAGRGLQSTIQPKNKKAERRVSVKTYTLNVSASIK